VIILPVRKKFVEPVLVKNEEKLDEVTRGNNLGSPPTDQGV